MKFIIKIGAFLALLSCFFLLASSNVIKSGDPVADLNNLFDSFFVRKAQGQEINYQTIINDYVSVAKQYNPEIPVIDKYGFWQFIPIFVTSAMPNTQTTFSAPCFQNNVITTKVDSHHKATFEFTASNPINDQCVDFYMIATLEDVELYHIKAEGTIQKEFLFRNLRKAIEWDLDTNGFRIFRFLHDPQTVTRYLLQTVALFEPIMKGPEVDPEFAELNLDFLYNYANVSMPKRHIESVTINESLIHSGDFFGITRLDGLDPMIIWGYGGATGHTATALWIDGELYVCESTVNSVYWPNNGIQKTPYKEWITWAQNASYNVAWVPLAPEISAAYNETAAIEFFDSVIGLPYGFHNFLFGWLDTSIDNLPCLPPAYNNCLTEELVQILSGVVDALDPALAYRFFNQAFNKRLGTEINNTAEIYQYAQVNDGITFDVLYTIPEEDEWVYNDGLSMVCDVFVCEMWKHAGLFGELASQINCTEQTPFDVYSMTMFDLNWTPPENCQEADPGLPYCQLNGKYRLLLNKLSTRTPYPLMDQTCPSLPPSYVRPDNC